MTKRYVRSTGILALVFAAALATGCATTTTARPSAAATPWPRVSLPFAEHVLPMNDAPVVVVDGKSVLVDGEVVGDVSPILASHRIQRIDGLFARLRATREAWHAAHTDQPFHGECDLVLDASTPASVVKSVFQTAAFAGYPFPSFVVRKLGPGSEAEPLGRIPADAQVRWFPPSARAGGKGDTVPGGVTPPSTRGGWPVASPRLAPEIIQRTIRGQFAEFRACYEQGLGRDPHLQGAVTVRFVIDRSGHVAEAAPVDSPKGAPRMPDRVVEACVASAFSRLQFQAPEGGIVTVFYPINFNPGE